MAKKKVMKKPIKKPMKKPMAKKKVASVNKNSQNIVINIKNAGSAKDSSDGKKSRWDLSIPKYEFKRRVKSGDISADIARAHKMIMELSNNSKKYRNARYKGASNSEKIDWLQDHIMKLTKAMKIVGHDDSEGKKDRFLGDHFDAKKDIDSKVSLPEPPVGEY